MNFVERQRIHVAAQDGDIDALRRALSGASPADVNDRLAGGGFTPLQDLCYASVDIDDATLAACARLLIASGADVNAPYNGTPAGEETTSLIWAAESGCTQLMKVLLDAGADVNATGSHSRTALLWSADIGSVEGVRLCLEAGAAVDATMSSTNFTFNALDLAADKEHRRLYPMLLRAGTTFGPISSGIRDPYLMKIFVAGGWARYYRLHLDQLTAMLTPQSSPPADGRRRSRRRLSPLRRIPPEVLRRIVAFAFHVGYY